MSENGNEHDDLQINIERFGPGPEVIEEVSQAVSNYPAVQEQLSETRHRLLSVRLLTPAVKDKPDEPIPPDRYRATIYDYTNNRVVLATGDLDDIQGSMEVSETSSTRPSRSCSRTRTSVPLSASSASYPTVPCPPCRGGATGRTHGAHARGRASTPATRGAPRGSVSHRRSAAT